MFHLNSHQLIDGIVHLFLNTGSLVQVFFGNDLGNLFVHAIGTAVTISYGIADNVAVFVYQSKVNTPGINTHAYRDLADLFTLFHSCHNFRKQSPDIP